MDELDQQAKQEAWSSVKGCHKINAKGQGRAFPEQEGVTRTTAKIIGGGLLNGTTEAAFTFTEFPNFVGTLTLTTKHGAIRFRVIKGTLKINETKAEANFTATLVAEESSGKLEGTVGTLVLNGTQNLNSGTFIEDVTGEICFE